MPWRRLRLRGDHRIVALCGLVGAGAAARSGDRLDRAEPLAQLTLSSVAWPRAQARQVARPSRWRGNLELTKSHLPFLIKNLHARCGVQHPHDCRRRLDRRRHRPGGEKARPGPAARSSASAAIPPSYGNLARRLGAIDEATLDLAERGGGCGFRRLLHAGQSHRRSDSGSSSPRPGMSAGRDPYRRGEHEARNRRSRGCLSAHVRFVGAPSPGRLGEKRGRARARRFVRQFATDRPDADRQDASRTPSMPVRSFWEAARRAACA